MTYFNVHTWSSVLCIMGWFLYSCLQSHLFFCVIVVSNPFPYFRYLFLSPDFIVVTYLYLRFVLCILFHVFFHFNFHFPPSAAPFYRVFWPPRCQSLKILFSQALYDVCFIYFFLAFLFLLPLRLFNTS